MTLGELMKVLRIGYHQLRLVRFNGSGYEPWKEATRNAYSHEVICISIRGREVRIEIL